MKKILFIAFLALISQTVQPATTKPGYNKSSSASSGYKSTSSSASNKRDTSPGCMMDVNPKAPSAPCPKNRKPAR